MIEYEKFISRDMILNNPNKLYVFGDNLQQRGYGGQAKEMRGCPNAVGIPTKRAPGTASSDYFSDDDFESYCKARSQPFQRLVEHILKGGIVVLPKDGIGTGLADLENRAPRIWVQLQSDLTKIRTLIR